MEVTPPCRTPSEELPESGPGFPREDDLASSFPLHEPPATAVVRGLRKLGEARTKRLELKARFHQVHERTAALCLELEGAIQLSASTQGCAQLAQERLAALKAAWGVEELEDIDSEAGLEALKRQSAALKMVFAEFEREVALRVVDCALLDVLEWKLTGAAKDLQQERERNHALGHQLEGLQAKFESPTTPERCPVGPLPKQAESLPESPSVFDPLWAMLASLRESANFCLRREHAGPEPGPLIPVSVPIKQATDTPAGCLCHVQEHLQQILRELREVKRQAEEVKEEVDQEGQAPTAVNLEQRPHRSLPPVPPLVLSPERTGPPAISPERVHEVKALSPKSTPPSTNRPSVAASTTVVTAAPASGRKAPWYPAGASTNQRISARQDSARGLPQQPQSARLSRRSASGLL